MTVHYTPMNAEGLRGAVYIHTHRLRYTFAFTLKKKRKKKRTGRAQDKRLSLDGDTEFLDDSKFLHFAYFHLLQQECTTFGIMKTKFSFCFIV